MAPLQNGSVFNASLRVRKRFSRQKCMAGPVCEPPCRPGPAFRSSHIWAQVQDRIGSRWGMARGQRSGRPGPETEAGAVSRCCLLLFRLPPLSRHCLPNGAKEPWKGMIVPGCTVPRPCPPFPHCLQPGFRRCPLHRTEDSVTSEPGGAA